MIQPKVLISVLNWNSPDNTALAVESVLKSNYNNYEIIILDNASSDNSVEYLNKKFPQVKLIELKSNLGYAGAHKINAERALKQHFDHLWILNNDAEVFPDTLQELIAAWQRSGDGLYGSVTLENDKETISFGGGLEIDADGKITGNSGYNLSAGKKINEISQQERAVSGIQGSSLLIPVNVIRKYGFMKTSFFLYGEETAYSYKLRNRHNIHTYIVPASTIIHNSGGSFKNEKLKWVRIYYSTRNSNIVHKKYQPDNYIPEMNFKMLPHYLYFFFKHYFLINHSKKDFNYWCNYYRELGNFHSLLRITGKYISPDKMLH